MARRSGGLNGVGVLGAAGQVHLLAAVLTRMVRANTRWAHVRRRVTWTRARIARSGGGTSQK
jgi:hypothetical protein